MRLHKFHLHHLSQLKIAVKCGFLLEEKLKEQQRAFDTSKLGKEILQERVVAEKENILNLFRELRNLKTEVVGTPSEKINFIYVKT